jgi:hypothetical protein
MTGYAGPVATRRFRAGCRVCGAASLSAWRSDRAGEHTHGIWVWAHGVSGLLPFVTGLGRAFRGVPANACGGGGSSMAVCVLALQGFSAAACHLVSWLCRAFPQLRAKPAGGYCRSLPGLSFCGRVGPGCSAKGQKPVGTVVLRHQSHPKAQPPFRCISARYATSISSIRLRFPRWAQPTLSPPFTRKDRTVCDSVKNTCGSHHTRPRHHGRAAHPLPRFIAKFHFHIAYTGG